VNRRRLIMKLLEMEGGWHESRGSKVVLYAEAVMRGTNCDLRNRLALRRLESARKHVCRISATIKAHHAQNYFDAVQTYGKCGDLGQHMAI
jgi:hypothetical protein